MATIKELVDEFIANDNYSDWDHSVAQRWLKTTKCGRHEVILLSDPIEALSKPDSRVRKRIEETTLDFIRLHFDERPEVVLSLDLLFAEFGLDEDSYMRHELLSFNKLYRHDEMMVLLLRHLQPVPGRGRYSQEDIAEHFLTSDRTIREYIGELRPAADDELCARVLGQVVRMDPARGTNVPESTTHPLFLPLSMLELYTLVDVLTKHVGDEVEGRIVGSILKSVLDQATPYAKERLERIDGYDEAMRSVALLKDRDGLGEAVMFHEKENIRAKVWYEEDGEEKTCSGIISRSHGSKKRIDITNKDGVRQIRYRDVIRVESLRE